MHISSEFIASWYNSGLTVLAGLVIGFIADFILRRYIHGLTTKTKWKGDELIVKTVAPKLPLWGLLAGIIVSLPFAPISPKVVSWLHKGVSVGLIISMTFAASQIASGLAALSVEGVAAASTTIFRALALMGVWGVGLTIIANQLGVSIAPILTAFGVGGLAVALALQDTLSNLFAGIHIILSRQVKVGDYVKLNDGAEGYVVDINWRNTSIRALTNNVFVVPNSKLAAAIAVNYYLPETEMTVVIPVGVSYKSDLTHVERVTIETATEVQKTVEGAVPDFVPFIRYHTFGDSSIDFSVIVQVKEFKAQFLVKHEFVKRLHARYRAEGIEIPFPQRVVTMEKEEREKG